MKKFINSRYYRFERVKYYWYRDHNGKWSIHNSPVDTTNNTPWGKSDEDLLTHIHLCNIELRCYTKEEFFLDVI